MGPYCIRSRAHWQESHPRGPLSSKAKGKTSLYKTKCLLTLFRAIILVPKAPAKGPHGRTSCQINVATRTINKENEASPQQGPRKNSNEKRTPRPVLQVTHYCSHHYLGLQLRCRKRRRRCRIARVAYGHALRRHRDNSGRGVP